ncbi:MAG: hypothetical protein AAB073_06835, partial [Pseudomonadota bacterium]
ILPLQSTSILIPDFPLELFKGKNWCKFHGQCESFAQQKAKRGQTPFIHGHQSSSAPIKNPP